MARRIQLPEFDPKRPLKTRRHFVANGHRFEPGQDFPWKRMALSQRQVSKLFEAGYLRHAQGAPIEVDEPARPASTTDHSVSYSPLSRADDLDDIDSLNELKEIARQEGAPTTVSKEGQRQLIRENRAKQ